MKKSILIISLFIISIVLMIIAYNPEDYKYYNDGLLYINEIMASNKHTIRDANNDTPDYIELYNGYDYDINLKGYYLSDRDNYNTKWEFPNITIKANSYLLVYASLKNTCDEVCYTNFKLSADGGVVVLSDKDNKVLSKIKYEKTDSDTSYGYNGEEYVYYYVGTPNEQNNNDFNNNPISRRNSGLKIRINEYTNNNLSLVKDSNGEYYSAVELYNYGTNDINLEGCYLSDKESNIAKYKFPSITIKSGEYLVIYLSGNDTFKNNEIHTNFVLTKNDRKLVLSSNRQELIDEINIVELLPNISASYDGEKFIYTHDATFGSENSKNGTTSMIKLENSNKTVIINEVSSAAIEIKNITDTDINLKDYKIKGNGSYIMTFPNVVIKANGYMILYESDNYKYSNGKIYTGFKINNTNEKITLYNNNNCEIDTFISGKLIGNRSYGINAKGEKVLYATSSIGINNSDTYYTGYAEVIDFSINGGYVDSGTKITLSSKDNSTIYYTLDGSYPTTSSKIYTEPITITKTTVIKVMSAKENYLNSDVVSRTYIVGRKHDMAVVSVSTNSNELYGSNGLFTRKYDDLEKKVSFEFYENDGSFGVMFNCGTNFVGQDSREFLQKSMAIHLRNSYGIDEITYPFFQDHDVVTFSSFTLRNSGEDVIDLKFKDAFLIEVLKGQMDLDYQYYRPVVVYVNGAYYGIYNIREKINESYVANNHGVNEDSIDLIKGNNDVRAGTFSNYQSILNYVRYHDMSLKVNYDYIKTQIDIQELINYWVVQTYYANTDTGNIRFWRSYPDGKWRWVLFDLDWAMYYYDRGTRDLIYPFQPYGHGAGGGGFSTTLTYNLYKNAEFREQYIKTFAYHLKNTFNPTRMNKIFDEVKSLYQNEMPYHCNRWYSEFVSASKNPLTMDSWEIHATNMKQRITLRYNAIVKNVKSKLNLTESEYQKYFGDI